MIYLPTAVLKPKNKKNVDADTVHICSHWFPYWPRHIGLIKSVLEQDSRLKLCWDFQEVLQGLIYQAHPIEFNACLKNVIDVQKPFSRTENHLASLSSKMTEVASVQKDPTCRAELAAPKMDPPDWDKYHACKRAFRRPFSRHFLEYGASNVLAIEAIIFPLRATCSFDETRKKTDTLMKQVENDKYDIETLVSLRKEVLMQCPESRNQARAA